MLRPAYLKSKLNPPIFAKTAARCALFRKHATTRPRSGKEREMCRHWQQVCRLTLDEAHLAAVSWQLRLALVKDAKLNVTGRHALPAKTES
jgi:hypothetical protein